MSHNNNNISNLMSKMSIKNAQHSSSAADHDNANNLADLFGSMKVGRRHQPYGKKPRSTRKVPLSGHSSVVSHGRATRSAVKAGKASLVQGLMNAKKMSMRATKMAVDAANQAEHAASLAAQAAAQVQAASAAASNAHIIPFNQASAALFAAYNPSNIRGNTQYGKVTYRRKKHSRRH